MATKNRINIVISAEDQASKPLRDVSNEMDSGAGKASKFSSALGSLGGMLGKTVLAAGAMALAAGTAGATIGLGFNSSVEQAETKLTAFMQDGEKVAKTLAWVKTEAAATQFSFTDMADAAANLTPVAKSSGVALEDLVKQAEVLAAINPAEGLTGATFSLREALSGDWVSIVDRFNLPRKRINELKEQGVPAMEIISRTLKEMGIDYSLVAKQGQTTAARFDQIKDKLTMMAGAAAQPIFERISEGLDALGNYDFEALGNRASDAVKNIMGSFELLRTGDFKKGMFADWVQEDSQLVDVLLGIRDTATQVIDYLAPKFSALGAAIGNDLFPALERLWHEALEPLAPVVGQLLVGSIGFFIDTMTRAVQVVTWFIDTTLNLKNNVTDAFNWIVEKANWLKDNWIYALGFMIGYVATLPLKLITLTGLAIAGMVNKALSTDWGAMWVGMIHKAGQAWDGIKNWGTGVLNYFARLDWGAVFVGAARGLGNGVMGLLEGAINGALAGLPGKPRINLPRFATGTNNAPGGWATVGEHGPENMFVPQGAQVLPAYRSRSTDSDTSRGGPTVVIENFNSYHERDDRRFLRDIGFALEVA